MLWLPHRWVRNEHRDAEIKLWQFLFQQAMDAQSLHRFAKKADRRQSYPIPLKIRSHLWTGDCGGRPSGCNTLSYPAFPHLLWHLLLPQWKQVRVCFEADQSFLSIHSTFLRDHFSFSKAPNIKEQINKRHLESIFQVFIHAFRLPTNFKILV